MKRCPRTATLAALAALLVLPIAARADIAPVPRPSTEAGGSATTGGSTTPPAAVGPVVKPEVRPVQAPVQPTPQATAVQKAPVAQTTVQANPVTPTVVHSSAPTTTVVVRAPEPAASSGGRAEAPVPVSTTGGRADEEPAATPTPVPTAPAAKLFPTKLVAVGHEPVPTYDAWPSWVLALLTVLISAEAFLVVRLSRSRQGSRAPQGISV